MGKNKFYKTILFALFTYCSLPTFSQTKEQKVDNIHSFAKLYGYVRYFYPGDEAASIAWDKFSYYGIKQVEQVKNQEELEKVLKELFSPIAPGIQIFKTGSENLFDLTKITPPDTTAMKIISWQHFGYSADKRHYLYNSLRTNRKDSRPASNMDYGSIISWLDAEKYQGKEIKLVAAIKTEIEEKNGAGKMWLRVDKKNGIIGFFDTMDDKPIRSPTWSTYEIVGKIDTAAQKIIFGCFLEGEGKVWVDDFKLFYKENNKWLPIDIENSSFEDGKPGEKPKGWSENDPDLYSSQINEEHFKGNQSVRIERKPQQVESPFEECSVFGDYFVKEIGNSLSCLVPLALYGTSLNTFPISSSKEMEKLSISINKINSSSAEDLYVRYSAIVKAWNVFKHFYPYFNVIDTNWEAELKPSLMECFNIKDEKEFKKFLKQFTAKLNDGHVYVYSASSEEKKYSPPIDWIWSENKLIISNVFDNTISIKKGDVVVKINGKPASDAMKEAEQYISSATDGWRKFIGINALLGNPENTELILTLKNEKDSIYKISVKCTPNGSNLFQDQELIKYRKINDDIFYLNITKITQIEIDSLMPELLRSKGLICDLRGYPKAEPTFITYLLTQKDTSTKWMQIPKIIYPDYEKIAGFHSEGWEMEPDSFYHLNSKVVFLIDGKAISYAESYLSFLEHYKLATLIGQPTAGTNGNVNEVELPGGFSVSFTGMKVVKHDGTQLHGVGIIPDIHVEQTVKGIREGRDEFMEVAIEFLKKEINNEKK